MMKRWLLPSLLPLCLTGNGCAPQESATFSPAEQAAVADTVTQLFDSCVQAESQLNPERCLGLMSADEDFAYFVNTTLYRSADSIATRTRSGFTRRRQFEMDVRRLQVGVLGPQAAVLTASMDVTVANVGEEPVKQPVGWTLAFVRRHGEWSVIQGHWTYGEPY